MKECKLSWLFKEHTTRAATVVSVVCVGGGTIYGIFKLIELIGQL